MANESIIKNELYLVEIANFTTRNYRGEIGDNNYDPEFHITVNGNTPSSDDINSIEVYIFIDNLKSFSGYLNEEISFPATIYKTCEISIRVRSQLVKTITSISLKNSTSIEKVNFLMTYPISNFVDMYNGCTSLKNPTYKIYTDHTIKDCTRMFYNCYMLEFVPAIHIQDNVKADYMFANTYNFRKITDVFEKYSYTDGGNINYSSAIGKYYNACMTILPTGNYSKCLSLNNFMAFAVLNDDNPVTDVSRMIVTNEYTIDISDTTQINSMFSNTSCIYSVIFENSNNIVYMDDLFNTNIDIETVSGLDLPEPISVIGSFYGAESLTRLCSINFKSSPYLISTFKNCSSMPSFNNMNFTNVIDMSYCFENCQSLGVRPNLTSVSNVIRARGTFKDCKSFTTLSELNLPVCKDISSFCSGCNNLTTLPSLTNLNSVIDSSCMFKDCTGATTSPSYSIPNSITGAYMFANCEGLTTFPSLTTTNMKDKTGMFMNCTGLTSGSTTFDNVENTSYMFYGCSNLTGISSPASVNNTSKVKILSHMFEKCTSLVNSPKCLNTESAIILNGLFKDCINLENVQLNTTNVETMHGAFDGCIKLHNLTINGDKCPSFSINGCNFSTSELISLINQLPDNNNETYNYLDCRNNPGTDSIPANILYNSYVKNWQIKPYSYGYVYANTSSTETLKMVRGYTLSESGDIVNSGDDYDFGFTNYEYIRVDNNISCKVSCGNSNIKVALYNMNFNLVSFMTCTTGETTFTFRTTTSGYIKITCNGPEISDSVTVSCTYVY